jgi:hypothetical protein
MIGGIKSAKSKLARARKHLKTIKRAIALYARSHPHRLTKTKGQKAKKLTIPRLPPREISILTGEMVYQMRSALDHLVFDVIKRNPNVGSIDPEWFEHCEFPLRIKLRRGQNPPLPKSKFAKALPGISDPVFAFIERSQPYYRMGIVNNALRFLALLSNIDKHRYINVARGRVRMHYKTLFASGLSSSGHAALDHGTEIPPQTGYTKNDLPVEMHVRFRAFVTLKEKSVWGDADTLPLDFMLQAILEQIETVIVPAFEKFIKKP